METLFEKFMRLSRLRMDPVKKAGVRMRLVQFIDARAAVTAQPASVPWQAIFSRRFMVPAGSLALIILVGAGTSLAAESALPGDPLYAVKVKINEPLASTLQVSDVAKAQWQTEVATRRLEEADKLAMTGQLNDGAKAEIEANFKESADDAASKIAALSAKGNTNAASSISTEFASTLKAHAEILAQIGIRQGNDADSLATAVGAALNTVAEVSGNEDAKVEKDDSAGSAGRAETAASVKIAAAKQSIAGAKDYIAKNSASLGGDAHAAADARIAKAEALLAQAQIKFDAQAWIEAFSSANRALRTAQETRVLAEAQVNAGPTAAAAPATGDRRMGATAVKQSLNLLEDHDGQDGGVFAGASAAGSVTSSPTSTSYIMNGEGETGSNP